MISVTMDTDKSLNSTQINESKISKISNDVEDTHKSEIVNYFSARVNDTVDHDGVCKLCDEFAKLHPQFNRHSGRNQASRINYYPGWT